MTFIYHANCCDGFCCAWLAHFIWPDAKFVPAHHNSEPPNITGEDVIIADFSYSREILLDMVAKAKSIKVFDHHATTKKDLDGLEFCIFNLDRCGASLIADYLCGLGLLKITSAISWMVRYIEDRDLWKKSLPFCDEIHTALVSYPMDFETWNFIASRGVAKLKEEGVHIRRAQQTAIDGVLKRLEWVEINGMRGKGCYATDGLSISEAMAQILARNPDIQFAAMWFDNIDGYRIYSLRSRNDGPDVGQMAKELGGGGHTHASGFRVPIKIIIEAPVTHTKCANENSK